MTDVFQFADEFGPTKVVHILEPQLGLRAILVVDNVATGPAIGGVRMAEDVSVAECVRLARAMTLKNAAAGLPHGGGKAVIFGDPKQPVERKEQLVRAFACAIDPLADYIPGPDMGTDETCMAWIEDEIGRAGGRPNSAASHWTGSARPVSGLRSAPRPPRTPRASACRVRAWSSRGSARSAGTQPAFSPRRGRCWSPPPIPRAPSSTRPASMWRS
jgi:glutamate dehydrogenase/leucine dehydrogenase